VLLAPNADRALEGFWPDVEAVCVVKCIASEELVHPFVSLIDYQLTMSL